MQPQPRELTDDYRLERILASSRGASILAATALATGRAVAVKLINVPPTGSAARAAAAAQRFTAAAAALATLRHPNLPQVLDSGLTPDGGAFLVLERLEGSGFDAQVLAGGDSAPEAVLPLLADALSGVEELARHGLSHFNLSPDNLFLATTGGSRPTVKLLGLGTPLFHLGEAWGDAESARFRAPELTLPAAAASAIADWHADCYSLAVVACNALGATVAFGEAAGPIVQMPLALSFELDNDEALRQILERCLRRVPSQRPAPAEIRAAFALALGSHAATSGLTPGADTASLAPPPVAAPPLASPLGSAPAPAATAPATPAPPARPLRATLDLPAFSVPAPAGEAPMEGWRSALAGKIPAAEGPTWRAAIANVAGTAGTAATAGAAGEPPPQRVEEPPPDTFAPHAFAPDPFAPDLDTSLPALDEPLGWAEPAPPRPAAPAPPLRTAAPAPPRTAAPTFRPAEVEQPPVRATTPAGFAAGHGHDARHPLPLNTPRDPFDLLGVPDNLPDLSPTPAAAAGSHLEIEAAGLPAGAPSAAEMAAALGIHLGGRPDSGEAQPPFGPTEWEPPAAAPLAEDWHAAASFPPPAASFGAPAAPAADWQVAPASSPAAGSFMAPSETWQAAAPIAAHFEPLPPPPAPPPLPQLGAAGPAAAMPFAAPLAAAGLQDPVSPAAPITGAPPLFPPAPLAPLAPVAPAAPPPEPPLDGSLLSDVDDLLGTLPPPSPAAAAAAAAPARASRPGASSGSMAVIPAGGAPGRPGVAAVADEPPLLSRLLRLPRPLLLGAAGVLVAIIAAAAFLFLRHRAALRAAAAETAHAEEAAAAPPEVPGRSPEAKFFDAKSYLIMGRDSDGRVRQALHELSFAEQGALGGEGCRELSAIEQTLAVSARETAPQDLANGLRNGDLGLLDTVVAVTSDGDLPPAQKADYDRAKALAGLYDAAQSAAARGDHGEVLDRFHTMESLSRTLRDPLGLREQAAAGLEAGAAALAQDGSYDQAVGRLEPLRRDWPERAGLKDLLKTYETSAAAEPHQMAILDQVPTILSRRKPSEGLDLLLPLKPTPHLAARIQDAIAQLQAQLAQLDAQPPKVELRDDYGLEYSRGQVVTLSFRVTDDYEVKSVKLFARPEGGSMHEMPLQKTALAYTIEIPPSFHQNGAVDFYVVATDRSGHEGALGSREQPLHLTRRQGFERILH